MARTALILAAIVVMLLGAVTEAVAAPNEIRADTPEETAAYLTDLCPKAMENTVRREHLIRWNMDRTKRLPTDAELRAIRTCDKEMNERLKKGIIRS